MPFENPELDTDEDSLVQGILDGIAERIDGWEAYEGAPEVALAEEIGRETAATNALVIEALDLAVAGMGETVFRVPALTGTAASVQLQLTLSVPRPPDGTSPVTTTISIESGFTVLIDDITFQTAGDITTPVTFSNADADNASLYGTVNAPLTATTVGVEGNVNGTLSGVTVVTNNVYVASVELASAATGGTDPETVDDYLDRLGDYLSSLRPGGVLGSDLAAIARTVPGVQRALGLDLYDPADGSTDNERTATVVAIDALGQPVTAPSLAAALAAVREVNFVIHLAQPTYTTVSVAVAVHAAAGVDHAVLQAAVESAILSYIHPAVWGSTAADASAWVERTKLRAYEIAAVVFAVPGVAAIDTITLNGSTDDLILDGPAALPTSPGDPDDPSTATVTVTS